MFLLEKEQKVYEISGVKVGGQPGVNPTVLIGSIFYQGHRVVRDERKGDFDKKKAEVQINKAEELSDKYGNPFVLDVVGPCKEAFEKYIDFVSDVTAVPFLLDGVTEEARMAAVNYVSETGLHERAVFNSINQSTKPFEIDALKESKVRSAIVFTYNLRNPTIEGRLSLLKQGAEKNLLAMAKQANIEKIFIDTCALDPPDLGPATKTIFLVKSEFGYPAGCGSGNSIDLWEKAKELEPVTFKMCCGSGLAFPAALGADFILYGPIGHAKLVFPTCALFDSYLAYAIKQYGIRPPKSHPLYRIF